MKKGLFINDFFMSIFSHDLHKMNGLYINQTMKWHKNSSKETVRSSPLKLQTPLIQTQDKLFSCFLLQNIWQDWQRFATRLPSMDYSFR